MKHSFPFLRLIPAGLSLLIVLSCTGAWAVDASSCLKALPATLGDLHAQKQKPKIDSSTEQLFYEMAQSDGTGMAEVPVGSIVANKVCAQSENQQSGQSEQRTS